MNSQNTTTTTKRSEEETQPCVASTVVTTMSLDDGICARRLENLQDITPVSTSRSADVSDVSDIATVGDERLTVPSSEDPHDNVHLEIEGHFLDARCPESLECLVDPAAFPGDPFQEEMDIGVPVDSDETVTSVVSTAAPETGKEGISKTTGVITGKRRKRGNASESEDEDECFNSDLPVARRLRPRPRKARIIEDSTTTEDENKHLPPSNQMDVLSSVVETTTGEADTQVTDVDDAVQKEKKKKLQKKRSSPIAPKLHPLVDAINIRDHTVAAASALAIDWIEDLDTIRKKINIQGVISGMIKDRSELIREVLRYAHDLSLRPDNPNQMQIRNARLVSDNLALQRENNRLKLEKEKLEEALRDSRNSQELLTLTKATQDAETSTVENLEERERVISNELKNEILQIKHKIHLLEVASGKSETITSLPEEVPLPQREPRKKKPVIKSIMELNPPRKVVIKMPTCESVRDPHPGPSWDVSNDDGDVRQHSPEPPGICSYASVLRKVESPASGPALVPETKKEKKLKNKEKGKEARKMLDTTSRDEDTEGWKEVGKKKKKVLRKRKQKEKEQETKGKETIAAVPVKPISAEKSSIQILQKRIPKTSAVVIKGKTDDVSYADMLTRLKSNINREELGITNTKIKKTASGALLIEIPGSNSKNLAEELCTRAAAVLGEAATVSRPEVRGSIRIVGFDESVNASEIVKNVAALGGCNDKEVVVSPITPMRNGLYMTWIKCPATAAVKACKIGRISLGWTIARLELQKPEIPRCHKCWLTGHHQANCTSDQDRTKACFRCGEANHKAANCTKEAHCIVCAAHGLSSQHRMGSYKCDENNRKFIVQKTNQDKPNRRSANINISNDKDSAM